MPSTPYPIHYIILYHTVLQGCSGGVFIDDNNNTTEDDEVEDNPYLCLHEADLLIYVLRGYGSSTDCTHYNEHVDPVHDLNILRKELMAKVSSIVPVQYQYNE